MADVGNDREETIAWKRSYGGAELDRKKFRKRMVPAAVIAVLAAVPAAAYADEPKDNVFVAEPGNPYDEATWNRIHDNVLEYDEIGILVEDSGQSLLFSGSWDRPHRQELLEAAPLEQKRITAEACIAHLYFTENDYATLGTRIKCNPSIKTHRDREALRLALKNGLIDTVGTDHAPHLETEKQRPYTTAPSGLPSIQQSLPVLLTIASQENIPLSRIASVFSEKAAEMFGIQDRGFVKEGCYADLVTIDPECTFTVDKNDLEYKCGWSPYEGTTLTGKIDTVFVNGHKVVRDGRPLQLRPYGKKLVFKK